MAATCQLAMSFAKSKKPREDHFCHGGPGPCHALLPSKAINRLYGKKGSSREGLDGISKMARRRGRGVRVRARAREAFQPTGDDHDR